MYAEDADYAGTTTDGRPVSGVAVMCAGSCVCWLLSTQKVRDAFGHRGRVRRQAPPRATLRRSLGLRGGNCAGRRLDSTTKEEGD